MGHTQMEYLFVHAPEGVQKWVSVYICMCMVVEYCASENVTLAVNQVQRFPYYTTHLPRLEAADSEMRRGI